MRADLKQTIAALESRLSFLERLLKVEGEWITPAQAAEIWPFSKDRITTEIDIAEKKRILRQPCDLKYGEHYISLLFPFEFKPGEGFVIDSKKKQNTWQIHREKFWAVISRPVEERRF